MGSWLLTDRYLSGRSDWSQRGSKASASKNLNPDSTSLVLFFWLTKSCYQEISLLIPSAVSEHSVPPVSGCSRRTGCTWDWRNVKTKWAAVFLWQSHHPASVRSATVRGQTVLQTGTNQEVCVVLKITSVHFQSCWAGTMINAFWKL